MALSLAKSGWFNGNPEIIMNTPVDVVMQAYNYEFFTQKYEETYIELNTIKGK